MNDDHLIAAVGAGDDTALRELFDRHAPWLAARLRRVLPADAVEDVLQETFIAVWRGARAYRGTGEVGGWIWGIARRQAALWARRHGRAPALPLSEPVSTEDPAAAAVARADLERALAALGPAHGPQRELARLLFVEARPMTEIARHLGIPQGTVRSRAYKLRQILRAALTGGKEP